MNTIIHCHDQNMHAPNETCIQPVFRLIDSSLYSYLSPAYTLEIRLTVYSIRTAYYFVLKVSAWPNLQVKL